MEYFELIKTIEIDIENDSVTASYRIELLRSNIDLKKYRVRCLELMIYNLYPTFLNSGSKGEDLHFCHSSDRLWRECVIFNDEDLLLGFISESEQDAIERAVSVFKAGFSIE